MDIKPGLSKRGKIIIIIIFVLILGGGGGYLLWRTNQPDTVAPTDSEAASSLCSDADYAIKLKNMVVCAPNCNSECVSTRTFSMEVPQTGKYTVKGVVGRGHCESNGKCQCQDNEEFYLIINGTKSSVAKDDHTGKTGCKKTTILQELGDFNLEAKTYTVQMISAGPECGKGNTNTSSNSVDLDTICLYSVPVCGDGVKNGTESCDPLATPSGCESGYKCSDACTCTAIAEGELDLTKRVAESCMENGDAQLTYTITVSNYGNGTGYLSSLIDTLDEKILTTGVSPTEISGNGVYSSGSISWAFADGENVIDGGKTKTFKYKVIIDKENFGIYANTAKLTYSSLEGGEAKEITADVTSSVDCVEDVPQTGLFDSTVIKIVAGIILLLLGFNLHRIDVSFRKVQDNLHKLSVSIQDTQDERRKRNFEKKIVKK